MTTLDGRPNTALLVIDVQNGVVGGAHERDAVVANVGSLVDRARREQVPVVWVQDDGPGRGSDDWQIVPELSPDDAEPRIEKAYADSFEETPLESVLAGVTFARMTPNTITSREDFLAELARVRAQGWAHDREENENSINCIGAPVRDASGRAVVAVSVSVPDIVRTYDGLLELLPALLTVTDTISRDCGFRPGPDTSKGHPA